MSSPEASREEQARTFKDYIQGKHVLVCDSSATSRNSMQLALTALGAQPGSVVMTSKYEQAELGIQGLKPEVIICDYDLGKRCGLDLLQKQRLAQPEHKKCLFILVTGNTSQTAVARAAEEDVDTFILKPFTSGSLKAQLLKTCHAKMKPSDYLRAIETAKQLLAESHHDAAIGELKKAIPLDPAPTLAHFYLGQAYALKKLPLEAEASYSDGLSHNKIHYKCLIGLYEILLAQEKHREAYEISKRITQYFPVNPQRLTQVLKLAVVTQSYDDVERYYQLFTRLGDRSEEVVRYVCAALVVCGKHYLQGKFNSRALELFDRAATAGSERIKVLQEVVMALIDGGLPKEASRYLQKFPATQQSSPVFQALTFVVADKTHETGSISIDRGKQLIQELNIHEPMIYSVVIRRSAEAGQKADAALFLGEAAKRWPEQKQKFQDALGAGGSAEAPKKG